MRQAVPNTTGPCSRTMLSQSITVPISSGSMTRVRNGKSKADKEMLPDRWPFRGDKSPPPRPLIAHVLLHAEPSHGLFRPRRLLDIRPPGVAHLSFPLRCGQRHVAQEFVVRPPRPVFRLARPRAQIPARQSP